MNKAIKIIVLILSLALVAGLFVFLLNLDLSGKALVGQDGQEQAEGSGEKEKGTMIILPKLFEKEEIEETEKQDKSIVTKDAIEKKATLDYDKLAELIEMPADGWNQENLASQISKTVELSTENNEVNISYAQPDIPKDYHFTFKAEIFDENGKTIDRYVSDAGWLSDSNNYDPSEKFETIRMHVENMKDRCAIISVKVGDSYLAETATTYQLTINYDGSEVWNTGTWNAK